jgi:hypothetical protein
LAAVAFYLGETRVVKSTSCANAAFSLSELPGIVGLFFLSPPTCSR